MCTQKPSSEFNWLKQFDTQWGSREDYGLSRGFLLPISLGALAKNTFVGATGIFRAIFASHATFSETCRGKASFPLPDINRKVEKDNNGENVGFGGVWKDLNANLSKIDHHGF
uniref:Dehydration-responsive element-binding protein 2D n=1 Tax=Solanum tuberosum TaxID=4113 RepID=M1BL05_SOLTU